VQRVYPTPQAAARGDLPAPFAQTLGFTRSPDGQHALVLIGVNDPDNTYPYQVLCHRHGAGDRWVQGSSANGPGWTATGDEAQDVGVLSAWGPAAPSADVAVVEFAGRERDVAVRHGYYLFVAWGVGSDERDAATERARPRRARWLLALRSRSWRAA
jgi:hypothetical protein